jgi:hypothetical protein
MITSSHDESGTLKLLLSSQRNFQGSAQNCPAMVSRGRRIEAN